MIVISIWIAQSSLNAPSRCVKWRAKRDWCAKLKPILSWSTSLGCWTTTHSTRTLSTWVYRASWLSTGRLLLAVFITVTSTIPWAWPPRARSTLKVSRPLPVEANSIRLPLTPPKKWNQPEKCRNATTNIRQAFSYCSTARPLESHCVMLDDRSPIRKPEDWLSYSNIERDFSPPLVIGYLLL